MAGNSVPVARRQGRAQSSRRKDLGAVPLSSGEVEYLSRKDEAARRRERLIQVREHERLVAQQVTQRYRDNLKRLQRGKRAVATREHRRHQEHALSALQVKYQYCLQHTGTAQRNARRKLTELAQHAHRERDKWETNAQAADLRFVDATELVLEREARRMAYRRELERNLVRLKAMGLQHRGSASAHAARERALEEKMQRERDGAVEWQRRHVDMEISTFPRPTAQDVTSYQFTRTHCLSVLNPPNKNGNPTNGSHGEVKVIRHNRANPSGVNAIKDADVYRDAMDQKREQKWRKREEDLRIAAVRGTKALDKVESNRDGEQAMRLLAAIDQQQRAEATVLGCHDDGRVPLPHQSSETPLRIIEKQFAKLFEIKDDELERSVGSVSERRDGSIERVMATRRHPTATSDYVEHDLYSSIDEASDILAGSSSSDPISNPGGKPHMQERDKVTGNMYNAHGREKTLAGSPIKPSRGPQFPAGNVRTGEEAQQDNPTNNLSRPRFTTVTTGVGKGMPHDLSQDGSDEWYPATTKRDSIDQSRVGQSHSRNGTDAVDAAETSSRLGLGLPPEGLPGHINRDTRPGIRQTNPSGARPRRSDELGDVEVEGMHDKPFGTAYQFSHGEGKYSDSHVSDNYHTSEQWGYSSFNDDEMESDVDNGRMAEPNIDNGNSKQRQSLDDLEDRLREVLNLRQQTEGELIENSEIERKLYAGPPRSGSIDHDQNKNVGHDGELASSPDYQASLGDSSLSEFDHNVLEQAAPFQPKRSDVFFRASSSTLSQSIAGNKRSSSPIEHLAGTGDSLGPDMLGDGYSVIDDDANSDLSSSIEHSDGMNKSSDQVGGSIREPKSERMETTRLRSGHSSLSPPRRQLLRLSRPSSTYLAKSSGSSHDSDMSFGEDSDDKRVVVLEEANSCDGSVPDWRHSSAEAGHAFRHTSQGEPLRQFSIPIAANKDFDNDSTSSAIFSNSALDNPALSYRRQIEEATQIMGTRLTYQPQFSLPLSNSFSSVDGSMSGREGGDSMINTLVPMFPSSQQNHTEESVVVSQLESDHQTEDALIRANQFDLNMLPSAAASFQTKDGQTVSEVNYPPDGTSERRGQRLPPRSRPLTATTVAAHVLNATHTDMSRTTEDKPLYPEIVEAKQTHETNKESGYEDVESSQARLPDSQDLLEEEQKSFISDSSSDMSAHLFLKGIHGMTADAKLTANPSEKILPKRHSLSSSLSSSSSASSTKMSSRVMDTNVSMKHRPHSNFNVPGGRRESLESATSSTPSIDTRFQYLMNMTAVAGRALPLHLNLPPKNLTQQNMGVPPPPLRYEVGVDLSERDRGSDGSECETGHGDIAFAADTPQSNRGERKHVLSTGSYSEDHIVFSFPPAPHGGIDLGTPPQPVFQYSLPVSSAAFDSEFNGDDDINVNPDVDNDVNKGSRQTSHGGMQIYEGNTQRYHQYSLNEMARRVAGLPRPPSDSLDMSQPPPPLIWSQSSRRSSECGSHHSLDQAAADIDPLLADSSSTDRRVPQPELSATLSPIQIGMTEQHYRGSQDLGRDSPLLSRKKGDALFVSLDQSDDDEDRRASSSASSTESKESVPPHPASLAEAFRKHHPAFRSRSRSTNKSASREDTETEAVSAVASNTRIQPTLVSPPRIVRGNRQQSLAQPSARPPLAPAPPSTLLDRLASGERAKISAEEMRARTRRNYQRLPEVTERKRQEEVLQRRRQRLIELREQEKNRRQQQRQRQARPRHT